MSGQKPGWRELFAEGAADDELLGRLAELLETSPPAAGIRARLMDTVQKGGRLHRFSEEVAKMLDITNERAQEMLDNLDRREMGAWEDSPFDGVKLCHVDGGEKVKGAITGFVRIDPGKMFPDHDHQGGETVIVLQGRCRDTADGRILGPGDVARMRPEDGIHRVEALPGPRLIYLAVVFEGIKAGDVVFKHDSPYM